MKAKMKPHKLLSLLLALVMVVGMLPMGQVAYAEDTTSIDAVYLTYDASKVNLNTAYTEGEVESQVRNNISSATNGVSVDKLNSGLSYLDDYKVICGVGDGTRQIKEGRTYIVRYNLLVASGSGYDWADKSYTPAIKFYLNGTETTPYDIDYNSSWNSYRVYFKLGTPSTEPIVNRVSIDQSDVSVQVGNSFSFTATVAGNVADKTVTWSVSGAASSDTKISNEGVLSVGSDETATTVTVTATSKADSSKSASRTVTITAAPLTIDSVTVSPSSKELYTGDTCSFTVTVTGTENDKSVTWSVTGQTSASTAITSDGTLTVGKDETAENITVKAVSNADSAKFGEASITIKQIVIIDKVSLTYDASKVNLNTAYTEGEVDSQVRNNISSATTGVSVDKLNSGLRYLDEYTNICAIGDGTRQITEGRTYIVRYNLLVAKGYDWADKSDTTAIKFYLNGTETTPYAIDYHSSWNAYRVYFKLGTPSTEPHTHTFNQKTIKNAALKTPADCTNDAVYYKSCSCGTISTNDADTFTATDSALGHDYTKQVETEAYLKTAASNCTEYNVYWYACSRCDVSAKDDAAATDKYYTGTAVGNHSFTEKIEDAAHYVAGTGTNCQSVKKYYYDCAYCDQIGTTTWDSTTYGEHNYAAVWSSDESGHWHECSLCPDKKDEAAHTAGEWIIDTAATATTDGTKHKECTECGYKMETGTIPATGGGYIPTVQKPVIEGDAGAAWTLSSDGTKLTISAKEGFTLADVTLNGVSKGQAAELTGLKTGDKVVIRTVNDADVLAEKLAAVKLVARSKMSAANGKAAVKVYWFAEDGSDINFDGYEIFRSTKRYSGYGKTPFFETGRETYWNTAIKGGNTYYYKVRGYIELNGERYYTEWSKKAIRTVK